MNPLKALTALGCDPIEGRADWLVSCPAHDDSKASLSVTLSEDRVLICCHAGCQYHQILLAVGLRPADLLFSATEEQPGLRTAAELDYALCDQVYRVLLENLRLRDPDHAALVARGLSDQQIAFRSYRSFEPEQLDVLSKIITKAFGEQAATVPGFHYENDVVSFCGPTAGLVIPVRNALDQITAIKIRTGGNPKYCWLSSKNRGGTSPGNQVHVPRGTDFTSGVVRATEGELKADVCAALAPSIPTISVPGVSSWSKSLDLLKEVNARRVVVAFDAPDLRTKPSVLRQTKLFLTALDKAGFEQAIEIWSET
jgi:hypothetical protein